MNDRAAEGGFAATRFAHHAEDFAFFYRQPHPVNRSDDAKATFENQSRLDRKMRLQGFDFEKRSRHKSSRLRVVAYG